MRNLLILGVLASALAGGCAPAGLLWERESRPDGTILEKSAIQIPKNVEDVRDPEVGPAGAKMGRLKAFEIKGGTWVLYLVGAFMVAAGAIIYFGLGGFRLAVPGLSLAGAGFGIILLPAVLPILGTIFLVGLIASLAIGGVWAVSSLLEKRQAAKADRAWEADLDRQMEKLLGEALGGNQESASAYKALYRVRHPEAHEVLAKASGLRSMLAIP